MPKKIILNFFLLLVLIIAGLISCSASKALTVGPVKAELRGDPGETLTGEFFLMNEGDKTKTFYSTFETYVDLGGEKRFIPDARDLATWVETQDSVTLAPKEQIKIPYTINIPENAPAGSLFAVSWWGTAPPDVPGQGVGIASRAGILMLLTVSGDIHEELAIKTFAPADSNKILNYLPSDFTVVVENKGNVYSKPVGSIVMENILGIAPKTLEVNRVELEVYPRTDRGLRITLPVKNSKEAPPLPKITNEPGFFNSLKNEWNNFGLGPYTASLRLAYGNQPVKTISQDIKFWVIPWRILTIAGVLLLLILLFFTKGIKTYNRWIIKRAQKMLEKENLKS